MTWQDFVDSDVGKDLISGAAEAQELFEADDLEAFAESACARCFGAGRIKDEDPCKLCGGKGGKNEKLEH